MNNILRSTGGSQLAKRPTTHQKLLKIGREKLDDAAAIYPNSKTMKRLPHGGLKRIIERAKVQKWVRKSREFYNLGTLS
jgi:hypothetical protein